MPPPAHRRLLLGVAASAAVPRGAAAQGGEWTPDRPIRFLQGFAPGGTTDTLARLIAPELAASFGQTVLVEDHPGAGGALAAEALARARPDGRAGR